MDAMDYKKLSEIRFQIEHNGIYLLKFYGLNNTHNIKILQAFIEEFDYEGFCSVEGQKLDLDYILEIVQSKTENLITNKILELIKKDVNTDLLVKEIKAFVNELAIKKDFD
jgi:hypothetical protein